MTLRELVAKEQVFAPCIWDCMSARAAEAAGFKATLLSGGAFSGSVCGLPDIGLITADDLVRETEYIAACSPLPCIVDADDGYGEGPLNAYRSTARLVKAGAMSLTVDDTTASRGDTRWGRQLRSGSMAIAGSTLLVCVSGLLTGFGMAMVMPVVITRVVVSVPRSSTTMAIAMNGAFNNLGLDVSPYVVSPVASIFVGSSIRGRYFVSAGVLACLALVALGRVLAGKNDSPHKALAPEGGKSNRFEPAV